jgi:hypothetical protein
MGRDRVLDKESVALLHRLAHALLPAAGYDLVEAMKLAVIETKKLAKVMKENGIDFGEGELIVTEGEPTRPQAWVLREKADP